MSGCSEDVVSMADSAELIGSSVDVEKAAVALSET